jgi:3-oxoacyl-[acyl-carrier protein] reductase
MELQGKAAIVTGSATGVGRETAIALARKGCGVLVNYTRSKEDAEATYEDVRALGVKAVLVQGDVSRDEDCRAMAKAAMSAFGRIDVLVNNAGTTAFIPHHDLESVKPEDFTRIMGVNLQGPFQMVRAARSALEAEGKGCVVNVSSVAGVRAIGSSIPYCASKAALNNLTIALARALAPKIRVNAVAPGFIAGRWLKNGLGDNYDVALEVQRKRTPLQRVCEPSDVADAIMSFVIGSQLVTGVIMPVEGGMLLGTSL